MLRRIKLLLAVAAAMTMLMVVAAPAMADHIDHDCFPFCDEHHDFDRHDLLIDEFDEIDEIDEAFVEVDDCEFYGYYGGAALFVCELDVDF